MPSAPIVQRLAQRRLRLIQAANVPAISLSTLLHCGDETMRELEKQRPGIGASPWGRAMYLMRSAVDSAAGLK